MFNGADPFSDADGLASKPEEVDCKQKAISIPQPVTPVPVLPRLPFTGDKGPNTHWVHGENIEIAVNM